MGHGRGTATTRDSSLGSSASLAWTQAYRPTSEGVPGQHVSLEGGASSWLDNWRRLVVRYDRHTDVYFAFLTIACFMTTLSKILGSVHDSRFLGPNAFGRRVLFSVAWLNLLSSL